MKIITYNIDGGNLQYSALVEFLKAQSADIVCINELTGMQKIPEKFIELQNDSGYEYGKMFTTFTDMDIKHPIGIMSKKLFHTVDHVEEKEFWHIFKEFYFPVEDMSVFVTHLTYKKYYEREKEAQIIADVISECKSKHIVLTGDINTLSILDKDIYHKDHDSIAEADSTRNKFTNYDGDIEYEVSEILSGELFDAFHIQRYKPTMFYTVPTLSCTDTAHFTKMRLDYFFVNDGLVDVIESCGTIYEGTNHISDHYPIQLILKL